MKMRWLVLAFVWILSLSSVHAQEGTANVVSFSPEGLVKNVRQVKVRFSEPMIPMGDPQDHVQPFIINCTVTGSGKWEDSTNWVYDFDKDLPGGIRAEFKLRPGLKTYGGKTVAGQNVFTFNTGGPSIKNSLPYNGDNSIEEEQFFVLALDCPADEASIVRSVYFQISGVEEKVGVRVIKGKARANSLKARRYSMRRTPDNRMVVLQARRRFPNEAKVELVWSKDLPSSAGLHNNEDQVLSFEVRPVFSAEVHCQRINAKSPCIPITSVGLNFSAPVAWNKIKQAFLQEPGGKKHFASRDRDDNSNDYVQYISFEGPFPEKATLNLILPAQLKDDAGRPLSNQSHFPLNLEMDEYPPLVKFAADFGILELNANPALPVTVRNVEPQIATSLVEVKEGSKTISPEETINQESSRNIINPDQANAVDAMQGRILRITLDRANQVRLWLSRLSEHQYERDSRGVSLLAGEARNSIQKVSIPKLQGPKSFEVVGIPLKKPGFYVVEIQSEFLGSALLEPKGPMYVSTAALVTNLSVHFKWGMQSSLVWVTTLDKGNLVSGAHVEIRGCDGNVLWQGATDQDGIARPAAMPDRSELNCRDYTRLGNGLMVTAQAGDDFSFTFSSWNDGIEPWRFNLPTGYNERQLLSAHTVFDRPLFRAGETVHMKHFLRREVLEGFGLVPSAERPNKLEIRHQGSDKKFEVTLKWLPDGSAESTWKIPAEANLGTYQLSMELPKKDPNGWTPSLYSGGFRVEEFRLPVLRASIIPPAQPPIAPARLSCGLQVSYLSGGGASDLKVKFRHQLQDSSVPAPEGFEGFEFSNGLVKEGTTRSSGEGDWEEEEGEEGPETAAVRPGIVQGKDLVLDKTGSAQTEILNIPGLDKPKEILAELEYPDPNGEIQTVSRRIQLYPSRWLIGIQPDSWLGSQEKLSFKVAVIDVSGKPVTRAPVQVELLTQKSYSHRSRLFGGFYGYEYVTETRKAGNFCSGTTNERGMLICNAASPVEGNVILQARTKDPEGRAVTVHKEIWIAGKESWWFNVSKDDRMDVLPEKKRYEPGETARFQVRMPFQEATALVSIEREGVSDVIIQKLTGKSPLVEVPVKSNYAPNVFVSVLIVRGRSGDPQPTAMVDLGRPAYKLGIAEIKVGWKGHELKVQVKTPKDVYQVREKVPVEIRVRQADNDQPAAGGEVAVAAVDEALLELLPNESWNLLSSMMGQRPYSVQTSTSQMHVIGKRHFGLKALPAGGGGGRQFTRELFDTLLLWRGRLQLDSQGFARLEIPLNDSLSSFRIVAIANSGSGRFGTGSSAIRSTQDLMLLSGIPPVVRQSDRFSAAFTMRNNTANAMSLEAQIKVAGLKADLAPQKFLLNANEAKVISWEITAPLDAELLTYDVQVQSSSGQKDRIEIKQKVIPFVPVKPWQATIFQLDGKQRTAVARPAEGLPGRGGIQVQLRPKIADGLPGVIDYMKNYPYSCLEQETSRAVSLRDKGRWDFIMERLPAYLDGNGLAKYFPSCRTGSVALTSYVLSIGNEADWTIPAASQKSMISGLRLFLDGKLNEAVINGMDLDIHKLAAMEALSRYGIPVKGWVQAIRVNPNLWPTSAVIDWRNMLQRQPDLPNHNQRAVEIEKILSARLDFRGTTMGFSTEKDDCRWWLMTSGDVNANRLILSVLRSPSWREDMPRLVRGTLSRQNFGHWLTTIANAWGVLAMEKFSQLFENQPVSGTTQGQLGSQKQSWDWAKIPKGDIRLFGWPESSSDIELQHQGSGKPWAVVTSLAAVPLKEPFSNGYRVKKTILPVMQKAKGIWGRGDIARVRLECEAQSDMGWVVVSDPIPGGGTILGSGLGRDSRISTQGEKREGWVFPAFEERSQEAFRAYYEYVPKGAWIVEYTVRLNNSGEFHLPATRVEALYSPEMLGEIPNGIFTVAP